MTLTDSDLSNDLAFYRKKLLLSMILPGIFVFFMWLVKIIEVLFQLDFSSAGIYPLTGEGLPGILLSPFIHADFKHLFSNTLPLFFLLVALFYFYTDVVLKICLWTYFLTGLLVWIFGRSSWHIGASGLVYGIASFLFFSGIIRRYFRLIALSLLIVFLYGSMVWGIFPGIYKNVSWESHMLGFFSGVILSIWFRKEGPQRPVYKWEEEDDEEPSFAEASEDEGGKGDSETIEKPSDQASSTQHPAPSNI